MVMMAFVLVVAGCSRVPSTQTPSETPMANVSPTTAVSQLDLSGKGLTSVPSYVFDRRGLAELDLSNNRLMGALPAEIRRLRDLRVLDASGNQMTGVPAEIGQLSNLVDLDLSGNKLTGLPLELGNLQNLRRFDLRGNNISKQDLDAIRANLKNTEILE